VKIIVALIAAALAIFIGFVFSAQNPMVIVGDFIFFEASQTLAEYVIAAFILGVVATSFGFLLVVWRLKSKLKAFNKQSTLQAIELNNLRKLPVKDNI
jgi:uncharacterized membrane protein YciS (DUF1049 family)